VTGMYLLVAIAALLSRRGHHRHTPAWRMPLWPAAPLLLIVVLLYILSRQETTYLLWTGGITAAATLCTSARAGRRAGWCRYRRRKGGSFEAPGAACPKGRGELREQPRCTRTRRRRAPAEPVPVHHPQYAWNSVYTPGRPRTSVSGRQLIDSFTPYR
jgi:hypothetical protein